MYMYHLTFEVEPTKKNLQYDLVRSAYALCWILASRPNEALVKADFHVRKYDWIIKGIKEYPTEVVREDFLRADIGLQCFEEAQQYGIQTAFIACARDGKTTSGPIKLEPSYKTNINDFLKAIKKSKNTGRCLHYDANRECQKIVNAHSIQKKQSLSAIAVDGHVYRIDASFGTLNKNKGQASCQKIGINKVSTFMGFCKEHDNDLFEKIDNFSLNPDDYQQIFLYAYRSLCRELFVKQNALDVLEQQLKKKNQEAVEELLRNFKEGTTHGLKNLKRHKRIYDKSLQRKKYENIRYVIFTSTQQPNILFSGLLYPDFDFQGRPLQNLADHEKDLELITFCSVPLDTGWGFLFAYHTSSSEICSHFMQSLAEMIYRGEKLEDMLFQYVICTCENHAFSPQWWESLSDSKQKVIIEKACHFYPFIEAYLFKGLEGIMDWCFDGNVYSNGLR